MLNIRKIQIIENVESPEFGSDLINRLDEIQTERQVSQNLARERKNLRQPACVGIGCDGARNARSETNSHVAAIGARHGDWLSRSTAMFGRAECILDRSFARPSSCWPRFTDIRRGASSPAYTVKVRRFSSMASGLSRDLPTVIDTPRCEGRRFCPHEYYCEATLPHHYPARLFCNFGRTRAAKHYKISLLERFTVRVRRRRL